MQHIIPEKTWASGMTDLKLQLHTATIHATFCSLVEQDETPLA